MDEVIINSAYFQKSLPFVLLLAIISLDQSTKYLIGLSDYGYRCNKGIAFGIGTDALLLPLLALVLVAIFAFFENDFFKRLAQVAIVGGGLSNLADRFALGCVRDFIVISKFPVFNFADFFISLGVVGLVLILLKAALEKNEA